jgi:holo-[acyl-carrier protein] synthase
MNIKKFGLGIDIVKVERFRKKSYLKNKSFYKKIFSDEEIKFCLKYKDAALHFAGKFAIKEAVKKSISQNVNFKDIQTSHSNSKPIVKIEKIDKYYFLASISHEKEFAVGVIISQLI